MTGLALLTVELAAKRLEVLHELLRTSTAVALLVNPTNPLTEPETRGVRDAARSLGLQLHVLDASTESEIDTAFGNLIELRAGALIVSVDPFLNNQRAQIVALAARHAVPAIYGVREFATAGGLMSYGNDLADAYRQVRHLRRQNSQGRETGRLTGPIWRKRGCGWRSKRMRLYRCTGR